MRAIQIQEFGGPEVLELVELPDPEPGDGEVVIEVARAGMNFADTHQRHNQYLAKAELPLIPGQEVAGAAGGRRVAAMIPNGGYAERVAVREADLVQIPDDVTDDQAAAILIQGLTAWALLEISARVQPGESVAVEGAAGGTGTMLVQLAKRMGARVIGLASAPGKRELVERLGADATIDSRSPTMTEDLLAANEGRPVDVIMQISGGESFERQMEALAPFGRMVTFGIATREANQIKTSSLMRTSRAVIGFWFVHLLQRPDLLRDGIAELLGAVASGELEVVIGSVYPMSDVARAQIELAERRTQGKLLLDPGA
ncbi:MAG TPA: NADPH:quinone oxidoreductase family protein [Solirubrobacterales bacterium]|nr:NADPH:quinone oxidoreductase family protein [Solirubrobacterales bacterium]